MNRLTGLLMKLAAAPWFFFSASRTGRCWREAHNGTAALAGGLNSRQRGHGAQQPQLWLLPILQVVSPRLSWGWGAESCQRQPGGKPHCKGLLSALQGRVHVPQGTELPCPCIINNFLILALSKDSYCCTGGFLSCVLWMGDIKYGANTLTLGELMPGGGLHFTRQPPIRVGEPPDICSRCFLLSKMHLQTWLEKELQEKARDAQVSQP